MSQPGSPAPLTGAPLAIASVALALGTFMQVLDTTIANVALPTISGYLGVSADQGTWIITAFAAANGVSVPMTGWLMGRYGVVRTYIFSVVLFTMASFLCGIAWSLSSLVIFRVLQGAVSGPMIPGSQALLISIFPPEKRSTALGIWSLTTLVAPVCGPILGGYISFNYHWSWIFFINLPIGAISAFFCWRFLKDRETPRRQLPIDTVGLGLLAVWVGTLQIMLDQGKDWDWFNSPAIVVLALISGTGFIVFIIWELTEKNPIVDLTLFRKRNFALGTIAFCLGYAVFFGNLVLYPLWLQTQLNYTPTWAGLVLAPSGVVAVVLTPFAARLMGRFDVRWSASFSFVAFAISYFLRARLTTQASFSELVWPLLFQGAGTATFFLAMVAISLDGIAPERIPSASGISNFARITSGGFAASIVTTLWDRRERLHQSRLAETPTIYNPHLHQAVQGLGTQHLPELQSYGVITHQMINQAFLLSSLDIFWISGWLSVAMLGIVWLSKHTVADSSITPPE
ncbi:MAG TPA: DHA2 family efflux MFS transporter permease subunit [Rhizomicrobium sp.]|nr:DHA2 family efflux MFS transporter permease subunit [Rhizomicrobium sp.]